ncbi:MAG: TetR/AcrR family transcriptional regulator [Alphaproteobacteria bacterium]
MAEDASEDRRVQRTQQALRDAFFGLVLSRRYDDIKIADIIEAAGVGRSTFYEHYQSKDDMLRRSMSYLFTVLADTITDAHDPSKLLFVISHFWENRRFASPMRTHPTQGIIVRALTDAFEHRLARRKTRLPAKLLAVQLAEGQMALLNAWLAGQASAPPERVAETLAATARAAVEAAREKI